MKEIAMTDPSGPALPATVARLLQEERAVPAPSPEIAARVFRRVGHTVAATPAAGAGGSLLTSAKTYLLAAVVAVGVGTVAVRASRPPLPVSPALVPVSVPAPPLTPAPPLAAPLPLPVAPAAPSRTAGPPRAAADDGLGAEGLLLLAARRSLAAGDHRRALARLRAHARRWPHGALEQEREILVIQTLAGQGADVAARGRAIRFLQRFPDSTLADVARQHAPPD
jgi:hypothetical protein